MQYSTHNSTKKVNGFIVGKQKYVIIHRGRGWNSINKKIVSLNYIIVKKKKKKKEKCTHPQFDKENIACSRKALCTL